MPGPARFSLTVAALAVACPLASCAPSFPEVGTPTPYDGEWLGTAESNVDFCKGITVKSTVRFGTIRTQVFQDGAKTGEVWGTVAPDGKTETGGSGGVYVTSTKIRLGEETGSGTWVSAHCEGTISFKRISGSG